MWHTDRIYPTNASAVPHHLLVDISAHGFGHLAQTAPVLNALRSRMPDLQLTIRSGLPHARLALRINGSFRHIAEASDFGLNMKSALDVDVAQSLKRYQDLHAHWDIQVKHYAQQLQQIKPDLVLANVSYMALAAAQCAHIPALAMCSLNWFDIFVPYAPASPAFAEISAQMLAAYNSSSGFLRLTPGMPMPRIQHLMEIGPIASQGSATSGLLHTRLGLAPAERLILVAMGGIPMPLPSAWPELPGYHWIVPRDVAIERADMIDLESLNMAFSDVLAACDCVFTKSGYGTFVEAAVCDIPVLYVERPDWPEEPCLVDWLKQHHRAQGIAREQFERGAFAHELNALMQQLRKKSIAPTGIDTAATILQTRLERSR